MTLPHERYRSLQQTKQFLEDLLDPKLTPKVPRAIRLKAVRCLRHFPLNFQLEAIKEAAPHILKGPYGNND